MYNLREMIEYDQANNNRELVPNIINQNNYYHSVPQLAENIVRTYFFIVTKCLYIQLSQRLVKGLKDFFL